MTALLEHRPFLYGYSLLLLTFSVAALVYVLQGQPPPAPNSPSSLPFGERYVLCVLTPRQRMGQREIAIGLAPARVFPSFSTRWFVTPSRRIQTLACLSLHHLRAHFRLSDAVAPLSPRRGTTERGPRPPSGWRATTSSW